VVEGPACYVQLSSLPQPAAGKAKDPDIDLREPACPTRTRQ
jgi:hypothetical protein